MDERVVPGLCGGEQRKALEKHIVSLAFALLQYVTYYCYSYCFPLCLFSPLLTSFISGHYLLSLAEPSAPHRRALTEELTNVLVACASVPPVDPNNASNNFVDAMDTLFQLRSRIAALVLQLSFSD